MVITCPECGHQGKIDPARIPEQGARAKCPRCESGFVIRRPAAQSPAAAPVTPVPGPPQHAAPEVTSRQPQEPPQPAAPAQPPQTPTAPTAPAPPSPPSPDPPLGLAGEEPAPGPAAPGGLSLQGPSPSAAASRDVACTGCLKLFKEEEVTTVGDRTLCRSCQESFQAKGQTPAASGSRPSYGMPSKAPRLDYAGFWIRVGAYLVDGVFLGLIFWFVVSPLFMKMFSNTFSNLPLMDPNMDQAQMQAMMAEMTSKMMRAAWITNLVNMILMGGYFIVLEGGPGQTLGKKALGLRVVTPEGERIGYLKAFARYIGRIVSAVILGIGFIIAAFDDEKRTLHDRMCDTRVIRV